MSLITSLNKKIIISSLVVLVAVLYHNEFKLYYKYFTNQTKENLGVFTQNKLAQYDGITYKNIYLAVLGIIFDVTEGKRHYQKGAGYHYFVGKDGSRALVTGNFKDESINRDHVIDLTCNELFTLIHWRNTFKQKYKEVGVLQGRFFDNFGNETPYAKEFWNKIRECEIEKDKTKKETLKYPPCNIAWSEEEGTKVWCTSLSGGVKRSWVGVPRQFYSTGVTKPQCICLNLDTEQNHPGLIKEYDNCPNTSTTCFVKT